MTISKEQAKRKLWAMKKVSPEGKTECDALIDEIYDAVEVEFRSLDKELKSKILKSIEKSIEKL